MSSKTTPRLNVDSKLDAAYLTLSDAPVARTVEFNDDILVDLDKMNVVTGIEFLTIGARIPLTELEQKFHIKSEVVASINLLLPSIETRIAITSGVDSVTRPRQLTGSKKPITH